MSAIFYFVFRENLLKHISYSTYFQFVIVFVVQYNKTINLLFLITQLKKQMKREISGFLVDSSQRGRLKKKKIRLFSSTPGKTSSL